MQPIKRSEVYYFTVQDSDDRWNLKLHTAGFELIPDHSAYPVNGHPKEYSYNFERGRVLQEFQLVYITKGKGHFATQQLETREINEGTMLLLKPGEWHTYRPDDATGWECYWVGFNGEATKTMDTEVSVIEVGYNEQIVWLYQKILNVSKNERPGYQQLLAGMLIHLLSYLAYFEQNKNWKDKEILQKIDKALLMIRENVNSVVSPEELASSLNISYSWFRRTFRHYTGVSPAQYISRTKIQKAKEMLSATTMAVKEIAFELGFESTGYFSTHFRKQTGQTPLEFRAMCQFIPMQKST